MAAITSRIVEEGDCQIWQGYLGNGVPMVYYEGSMRPVRLVFSLLSGKKIPAGGFWSSKCGERLCVNPAHSVHRTNIEHMAHLGARINELPAQNEIRKMKISQTRRKITDETLEHIMSSEKTCEAIAAEVGISKSMVARYRRVKAGKVANIWKGLMK
jgi:hypothetical protein